MKKDEPFVFGVMMIMNCFYGMADREKVLLFSAGIQVRDSRHCKLYDTPRAGFESEQNLRSRFIE